MNDKVFRCYRSKECSFMFSWFVICAAACWHVFSFHPSFLKLLECSLLLILNWRRHRDVFYLQLTQIVSFIHQQDWNKRAIDFHWTSISFLINIYNLIIIKVSDRDVKLKLSSDERLELKNLNKLNVFCLLAAGLYSSYISGGSTRRVATTSGSVWERHFLKTSQSRTRCGSRSWSPEGST